MLIKISTLPGAFLGCIQYFALLWRTGQQEEEEDRVRSGALDIKKNTLEKFPFQSFIFSDLLWILLIKRTKWEVAITTGNHYNNNYGSNFFLEIFI